MLDVLLRRDRYPRVAGIHKPPNTHHPRVRSKSVGAGGFHTCFVLYDAPIGRDSDLEQLHRAATLFSHRDADFSAGSAFFDSELHPAHWGDGMSLRLAIPDYGAGLDLHSFTRLHSIPLRYEFRELSRHTQNSMAGDGIRIDWAGTNPNHQVLNVSIARSAGVIVFPQGIEKIFFLLRNIFSGMVPTSNRGNYCAPCANPTVKWDLGVLKLCRKPSIFE